MPIIEPETGYDRYARFYHDDYSHLDSFDWDECRNTIWEILSKKPDSTVLDAGCGDGRALFRINRKFSNTRLWGWDISGNMLKIAGKKAGKKNIFFYRHDVCEVPPDNISPENGFNLIIALFLLVHVKNPCCFFGNMFSVLSKNGILVCNTIPQRKALTLSDGKGSFTIRYYNHSEEHIIKCAESEGFLLQRSVEKEHSTILTFSVH